MTVINTNTAAINAQYNLSKVQSAMDDAMSALSSGKRITSAADDAAGLSIVTRMESQVRGLNQAMRNAADGQSMVDTAEGAMDEIANMLQRMRELALQAANGSNSDSDRANLDAEVDQLQAEIDRVVDTTKFNGQNVLDGSFEKTLQVGSHAGETINVDIANMGTAALGSLNNAALGAVREANFTGLEERVDTKVQMTFNGNDTYDFTLTIDGAELSIANAEVSGSSAGDVVDKINEALRAEGVHANPSGINVTFSGNVVTIENTFGTDISIADFAADANSSATYVSLAGMDPEDIGDGESLDSVTLGGVNSAIGDSFAVGANDTAYSDGAATEATANEGAFTVSGSLDYVDADNNQTLTLTISAADHDDITVEVVGDTDGTDVTTAAITTALIGGTYNDSYTVAAVDGEDAQFTITRADGVAFTAAFSVADTGTVTDGSGSIAVTGGDALDSTEIANGSEATEATDPSGGSNMYLEFVGSDTYSFDLTVSTDPAVTTSHEVVFDGTDNGLQAIATQIGTDLGTDDWIVAAEDGVLEIIRKDGTAFELDSFAVEGAGRIMAGTDIADDTDGLGKLLEENNYVQAANTTGVTTGYAGTELDVTVSDDADYYSFSITDGFATAQVSAALGEDLAAAVNYALERANMGGLDATMGIEATATDTGFTLEHHDGGQIKIQNFSSDGIGTLTVAAATTDAGAALAAGIAKVLDDGDGSGGDAVSGIDISTVTGAEAALAVIDAALQDINDQRGELGAISNRLDHTISNLGNIVVNTEAAQSRIEDADFAAETGNLTKAQILSQAATAMLAQANASKQSVLSLLQG